METLLRLPSPEIYAKAAALYRAGELVAFPTETVYGLGANALDAEAVGRIFAAKGRPNDNPLIVHIAHRDQLDPLVRLPALATALMDAFWPGPLTLIMPRTDLVPDAVTAGLDTVAVRMPSHPIARAMLEACRLPIAAPSANRSGRPSPTTAAHVLEDMNGLIPLIIDGGPCEVGLESTVLDITQERPCILRPGGVTREMLEAVIGPVEVAGSVLRPLREGEVARSPGMRYRHYAPKGEITLVRGGEADVIRALRLCWEAAEAAGENSCVLCFEEHAAALAGVRCHSLGTLSQPESIANRLFDVLRQLDTEGMTRVYSEVMPADGIGLAVMNRLGRAAAFRTVEAADVIARRGAAPV